MKTISKPKKPISNQPFYNLTHTPLAHVKGQNQQKLEIDIYYTTLRQELELSAQAERAKLIKQPIDIIVN